MAISSTKMYGKAVQSAFNKEIDWDSDPIQAVLCSSTYQPNQDTHQYASSLGGELSGGGYARVALTSKTVTYTAATNVVKLSAADITFPALTGTFRYLVILDDTGNAATSPLISYADFGADQTASAQDVTFVVDSANGLVSVTVS